MNAVVLAAAEDARSAIDRILVAEASRKEALDAAFIDRVYTEIRAAAVASSGDSMVVALKQVRRLADEMALRLCEKARNEYEAHTLDLERRVRALHRMGTCEDATCEAATGAYGGLHEQKVCRCPEKWKLFNLDAP